MSGRVAALRRHLGSGNADNSAFQGRAVLVTGASRGIGRAVAVALAVKGARVAVHYNSNAGGAADTVALLGGREGHHRVFQADLSRPDEVERLVGEVFEWGPEITAIVNNAAIYEEVPVLSTSVTYEQWQQHWNALLSTNLSSVANLSFLAARRWASAEKPGSIVNVSSRGAYRGEPVAQAYGASKAGLNSLTQSMAKALGGRNISVTAVAPGFVETEMAVPLLNGPGGDAIRSQSPFGRVARPEEVADAVVYMASPGSRFHSGAILDINGASYFR